MKNEYKVVIKLGDELTDLQKDQLMKLSIAEYPPYEKYYRANKYYSVMKPQMVGLVTLGEDIIGTGKLQWQDVQVHENTFKLFGFGVLIRKEFHGKGLGTLLVEHFLRKVKELEGDLIYASSNNPVIDHILLDKLGFRKLDVPVEYVHAVTGVNERETKTTYVYFCNDRVAKAFESVDVLNIGTGPI